MAAVSAWSKPGAWALDSEENETELLQQHKEDKSAAVNGDFPSLSTAAATKSKKKKPQTLSLHEFSTYKPKALTHDEVLTLPTGPRERTAEELDRSKLGGGFRSYGGGGIRDEQPRRQGRDGGDREFNVSRADENDNWGAGKKLGFGGGERREREKGGGFFGGENQSRADDVDNWGAGKKSFVSSEPPRRRGVGFGLESSNGGADASGTWGKKEKGGAFDSLRDRRGGFEGDSESWGRKREELGGGGSGGSVGGRPKLNLQPRTLPVERPVVVVEEEKKVEKVEEVVIVPRAKGSNPFGEARPREEVLKEKGQDWKEIEEKLESKIKEVGIGSGGGGDGPKRGGFWSGRDRVQSEDKMERAWRRPVSASGGGSRPQRL